MTPILAVEGAAHGVGLAATCPEYRAGPGLGEVLRRVANAGVRSLHWTSNSKGSVDELERAFKDTGSDRQVEVSGGKRPRAHHPGEAFLGNTHVEPLIRASVDSGLVGRFSVLTLHGALFPSPPLGR